MEPKHNGRPAEEKETPWRTHRCVALTESEIGLRVLLCGFVEAHRDHKHQIFLHLRDGSGKIQVVLSGDFDAALYASGARIPIESVVQISGTLVRRPPGTERTNLDSKSIEVEADGLRILCAAPPPPFPIAAGEREKVDERLRLSRRYFELRSDSLHEAMRGRSAMVSALRRRLETEGFLEIETPCLTRQSPEGAHEFLVPARRPPGSSFALAQSPQLYKQMLMVAGFERYYQIARCFRDEDGRTNRQPEFTQLDLECAYSTEEEIRGVVERVVVAAASALGRTLSAPFPILTWEEAIERHGVDRPDLRFEMGLADVTDIVLASGFRRLRESVALGGRAALFSLPLEGGGRLLSNAELDRVREEAMSLGAPGLVWFRREGEMLRSDAFVERLLTMEERRALGARLAHGAGEVVFLLAAPASRLASLFSSLRSRLAARFGVVRPDDLRPCWIVRFPFFKPGTAAPSHHPFTSPVEPEKFLREFAPRFSNASDLRLPEAIRSAGAWASRAYDFVVNGEEIGSGSIRIHDSKLQRLVFRMLGYSTDEMDERFGYFLRALETGAPPHGGIALGIDRLFLTLSGREDLREAIAFPKALDQSDPLTGAPVPASR